MQQFTNFLQSIFRTLDRRHGQDNDFNSILLKPFGSKTVYVNLLIQFDFYIFATTWLAILIYAFNDSGCWTRWSLRFEAHHNSLSVARRNQRG